MYSQGYKPEPELMTFAGVITHTIITCLGIAGIGWLALGWAGKFI